MLTPESDAMKALDAELASMRKAVGEDRVHLRELTWMLARLQSPYFFRWLSWRSPRHTLDERKCPFALRLYVASVALMRVWMGRVFTGGLTVLQTREGSRRGQWVYVP